MTGVLMMKNEEIAQKLDKLTLLYQQLKALREAQGEEFSPEDEDLLSHAELLEEALKNYMYQFGLSIYRNKKGKRFFKKFIHEEDEVRGFDELDNQCFEFQEAEPSFLQRLLEYKPADRILMTKDVESTVEELYEKDQQMIDIFDELLNEEAERCTDIIKESEIEADIEKTFQIQNEITTPEIAVELDAPNIDLADIEKDIIHEEPAPERTPVKIQKKNRSPKPVRIDTNLHGNYQCGTSNVEDKTAKIAKRQAGRLSQEVGKDTGNER